MALRQRLEYVDPRPGKQSRNDFEGRVLRRRPNQTDVAFFHVREKCVLLGLIEAMDFVNKDDGARSILPSSFSLRHYLFDFFDADEHC